MTIETALLCALVRLSLRFGSPSFDDLVSSVREDSEEVRSALGRLARDGLVHRSGTSVRLSLSGLAVAVAASSVSAAKDARPTQQVKMLNVVPLARRRRAAA